MLKVITALLISIIVAIPTTVTANTIEIEHPWSKAVPPTSNVAAAFLSIINHSNTDDTLIAARSPIAESAELHILNNGNGLMQMRKVDTINIAAEHQQQLAPGGFHVMLFNLTEVPIIDSHFPLTLTFKHAGEITVNVAVKPATYSGEHHDIAHDITHDDSHALQHH
ncbi:copper chaperone PCu(A)C [Photobacterium phosphoreum]|jgi:hypothetical protein|uniref:copper chaperone PCu(A)C n=1 Tax=Photobacterium phosphoreum TaxID=659 RepID=UPI000D16F479|nr:copper chaperone PCu(A)C [Photobacterium phosphoreum]PSU37973.1 copper resistance protein CopZ [Photobacterium phosphoreum]PSU71029.1 copper resistance protein CopZ [Photobacterium phosphoreum]PSW09695.1 copper resistance protein CopZ [Photobacterium phosphoreum]PSW39502.1 copper resistance protein CopZ [Photobacterium phosphoreum]